MRKSILVALTMALSFSACGGGGDDTPPVQGDTTPPVFTSLTTASVEENQLSAITLVATDASSVAYSISESDAALFDVNETSGVVTFKIAPDFEDTTHTADYYFTAMAKDSADNNATQSITISILDVNETITHNGVNYLEVTSPYTGKVWLDRNLGASRVCTALDDTACYGDYYQWGRDADGHQESNSTITATLATDLNTSANTSFIKNDSSPYDWLDVNNNNVDDNGSLRAANWSKTDGSSICPVGFRVPTEQELKNETTEASTPVTNNTDAYNNFLKFPSAGYRYYGSGSMYNQGSRGFVWSSSVSGSRSRNLNFYSSDALTSSDGRAHGLSVRCLRD